MNDAMVNIIIDAVIIISINGFGNVIYNIYRKYKKSKNDINEINNAIEELDKAYNYYYHKRREYREHMSCDVCLYNRRDNCNNYNCPLLKEYDNYNAYSKLLKDIATSRDKLYNIVVDK